MEGCFLWKVCMPGFTSPDAAAGSTFGSHIGIFAKTYLKRKMKTGQRMSKFDINYKSSHFLKFEFFY